MTPVVHFQGPTVLVLICSRPIVYLVYIRSHIYHQNAMGIWKNWQAVRPSENHRAYTLVLSEKSSAGLPLYTPVLATSSHICPYSARKQRRRRRCQTFTLGALMTFTLLVFLTKSSSDPIIPGTRMNWLRYLLTPSWQASSVVPSDSRPISLIQPKTEISQSLLSAGSTTKSHPKRLVPLEAHIMSKCPDARDCLQDLILPAMEQVGAHVNFTLSFIGKVESDSSVSCKHGPAECLGNMLDLCAASRYPALPLPQRSLGFANCMTAEYVRVPERSLVHDCAREFGMDFDALDRCVSDDGDQGGLAMLVRSVERSSKAGVTKSCTVRLDEQIWCIRDGGEGCEGNKGTAGLVEAVEKLYGGS